PTVEPGGAIRVAQILRWPNWKHFEDAIIVSRRWEVGPRGEIRPQGACLNPLGRARRSADFDEQQVLHGIARAIDGRASQRVRGGIAIPVLDAQGQVWGGCWFALGTIDRQSLLFGLLPWFVVSTGLLTLVTYALFSRFVIGPVEVLARGARALAQG